MRQRIAILVGFATALGFAQGGQVPTKQSKVETDPQVTQKRLDAWTAFFLSISKSSEPSLLIDLQDEKPVPVLSQLKGYDKLVGFASYQFSELKEVEGVYVVKRKPATISEEGWRKGRLLSWLSTLTNEDLADLLEGNFTSDRMPEQVRNDVTPLVGLTDEMSKMYGDAPFSLEASLSFAVDYTDKNGVKRRFPLSSHLVGRLRDGKLPPRPPRSSYQPPSGSPRNFAKPTSSELNFGSGKLMTLRELTAEVGKAFQTKYFVDRRLRESIIFVSGGFTQSSFERAFETLTEVPAGGTEQNKLDKDQMIQQLLSGTFSRLGDHSVGLPSELSAEDILQRKSLDGGELLRLFPDLKKELEGQGIGVGIPISFSPGIQLYAQPGATLSRDTVTTNDGQVISVGAAANVVISLTQSRAP